MLLSKQLTIIAKQLGANYTLKDKPLPLTEVFSETGILPGLVKRADQLASLCLGYGLGATFEDAEQSLLGNRVIFDNFTPDVLRLFCIADVLIELVKTAPSKDAVPLDELMYD